MLGSRIGLSTIGKTNSSAYRVASVRLGAEPVHRTGCWNPNQAGIF